MTMQPAPTRSLPPRRAVSARIALAIGTLIVVAACGGDNNSNSPAAPTTVTPAPAPAPTPRLVQQGTLNLSAPKDDTVHFSLASITDNAIDIDPTESITPDPANQ